MASTPSPHASGTDRDRAAPVVRRQLLTTRGSQDAPPRVVLHLPDLDALSAVAIGPPRPAERRRVDAAHTVVAEPHEAPTDGKPSSRLSAAVKKQLLDLAKAPVNQLVEQVAPNGKLSIPRLVVLLQSPKILLAAVMALGLQFAALLAMFTGGATPDPNAATVDNGGSVVPDVSLPQVTLPPAAPFAAGPGVLPAGPIRTPLSTPNSFAPSLPGVGSPTVVAQPTMPPPQSLPGLKAGDVPPWGEEKIAPIVAAPSPTANSANTPAALVAPNLTTPSLPNISPTPPRTTPAVQTSDAGGKPKARLQGTIRRASTSETAP